MGKPKKSSSRSSKRADDNSSGVLPARADIPVHSMSGFQTPLCQTDPSDVIDPYTMFSMQDVLIDTTCIKKQVCIACTATLLDALDDVSPWSTFKSYYVAVLFGMQCSPQLATSRIC